MFVTDSVEGIVPDFLTLLHGVLDSPDIPLNVSRSYLQSDSNVKKISAHITKKVADRLEEIFKNDREQFEKKWDDLKLFIEYGMVTEEKFYEKALKFCLLKNTEGNYYTLDEYEKLVKDNQTDKNKKLIYLYATDRQAQYSFIEAARNKGYDVLQMDGHLDVHFINHLETKLKDSGFVRVDSDVVGKLIQKDETNEHKLTPAEQEYLRTAFDSQLAGGAHYFVTFEGLSESDFPVIITQSEFMRRMKDMSKMSGGGGMNFYGEMPDSYSLVVNANHPLVGRICQEIHEQVGDELTKTDEKIKSLTKNKEDIDTANKGKKEEEIPQADKDRLAELDTKTRELEDKKKATLTRYSEDNKLVKQLIDLALLANNMLKGEELSKFVKRSIEIM